MNSRNFRTVLLAAFLSLLTANLESIKAQKPAPAPYQPGEELIYKAEVSRSLLKKVDVATFRFVAERGANNSVPYSLKFTGDVASEGFFVKLFNLKFHQHVESIVDAESLSVQKTVKFDEQGKRVRTSEANFDQKKGTVVWTELDPNNPARPPRVLSADFNGSVQDVVSAIYYLRTQPLNPGDSFEVPISDSGRVYRVPVRVMEKRRMKTALGRINAVLVKPELFGEGGMVNGKGQISIWLTDDLRHIPVSAQLKGEFGTFDITLRKVSTLPNQQPTRAARRGTADVSVNH